MTSAAIGYEHRRAGLIDPTAHEAVRQVRRGLRRRLGTAPIRQARPLSVAEIRTIVARIDRHTPHGARDAARILLGFASALRRGELAALDLADLQTKPAGLLLTIRGCKTDPDHRGQVVGVAHGRHPATDPVAPWPPGSGTGAPRPRPAASLRRRHRLDARARAGTAGRPAARITGHSLRAGHATSAALAASASNASPPKPATAASTS